MNSERTPRKSSDLLNEQRANRENRRNLHPSGDVPDIKDGNISRPELELRNSRKT